MGFFKKLFQARINRRNYLIGVTCSFILILLYVLSPLPHFLDKYTPRSMPSLWYVPGLLVYIFFNYSLVTRRMHDLNCSYWDIYRWYSPKLGYFPTFATIYKAGDKKANKYGKTPEPKIDIKALLGLDLRSD